MGRIDLPDPVRDEDVWVSAQDLCRTRLCATPGCEWDAKAGSPLCDACERGKGQARLRAIVAPDNVVWLRSKRGAKRLGNLLQPLSPGEIRVLELAAAGMSTRATAEHLSRSVGTVKRHRGRPILNHTRRGGVVYDPFAGSGSALIAAGKHGRRAFLMEIDPGYCDVIRKRYETYVSG